jgi:hypothetical protein
MHDSVAMLESRFRALRDTLTRAVRMLDTADRTTRAYAVRYAEIRRRTLAAEAIRASRDSLRRREEALRMSLGDRAPGPSPEMDGPASAAANADSRTPVRAMTIDGTVTLSLAPGAWSIGLAPGGAHASTPQSVMVKRGTTQTVRIMSARPRTP